MTCPSFQCPSFQCPSARNIQGRSDLFSFVTFNISSRNQQKSQQIFPETSVKKRLTRNESTCFNFTRRPSREYLKKYSLLDVYSYSSSTMASLLVRYFYFLAYQNENVYSFLILSYEENSVFVSRYLLEYNFKHIFAIQRISLPPSRSKHQISLCHI